MFYRLGKKIRKTLDGCQPLCTPPPSPALVRPGVNFFLLIFYYYYLIFFSKMNLQLLVENGENLIQITQPPPSRSNIQLASWVLNRINTVIELHIVESNQESLIGKSTSGISIENHAENNIFPLPWTCCHLECRVIICCTGWQKPCQNIDTVHLYPLDRSYNYPLS